MANKQIMDGCTAAAYVAYALSDTATVYPITPVASMGQTAKLWAMKGRLNYAGRTMEVREMESELGAAGATHGAAAVGSLATTFTASQGLLLMIPNMYKIAGELLPVVFHVGSRSLATHALSIFGDHQDVMACRATGFALLASSSVQEAMDMAAVAHMAVVRGSVPVLHFFDGWRTSNEMSTIDVIDDDTLFSLVDRDAIERQRRRGLDPVRPTLRGSAQNPDVYFQNAEAANPYYNRFGAVVQDAMDSVARVTGRQYHTFDYTGAYDADRVIVIMASGAETAAETAAWLNARGEHVGVVNVRLYRPFDADALMRAIPATVRSIAVLDRTREPGAEAEPLALDVMAAVMRSGRDIRVIHGRYGLSSKDFTPSMVKAVYDNLASEKPLSPFTVGINDDVTHLSLEVRYNIDPLPSDVRQAIFYGMGSDGTVGATRQAASIIASRPGVYAQAYFEYSAKKSGGYTVSQLRYGTHPLHAAWSISDADIVLCNKDTYLSRFHITERLRDTGTLVINTSCGPDGLTAMMPAAMRRDIARRHIKVYTIDARRIATANGLGVRINTIMEAAFFKIADEGGYDYDITHLRDIVTATYRHEGDDIVRRNIAAIAAAEGALTPLDYPEAWADATDEAAAADDGLLPLFVRDIARVCDARQGDTLPVSAFTPDGTMPLGSTAYEKRGIADFIPRWDPDKCVTCTLCSLVCAHAAIRPVVMTAGEAEAAPTDFVSRPLKWPQAAEGMRFRIQVYPLDCTGCGSCATICPGKALTMVPAADDRDSQSRLLDYAQQHVTLKEGMMSPFTINGSQLMQPLLQFSGACGGCGETPYVKLLTQLFGPRMVIANATGCSSIWGADYPSVAYCANKAGRGPAWGNSLFEDNAEYGYGMAVAIGQRYNRPR